jgi:hypothetical protein
MTAVVNFKDKKELLVYCLSTIKQVELTLLQTGMKDEEKSEFIINVVKKAVNASVLTDEEKALVLIWCDVALPHIVEAWQVANNESKKVANEIQKVVVADMKKCCGF